MTVESARRITLQTNGGAMLRIGDKSMPETEGEVLIDPSARIESSTVRGPAVIGPAVRLESAYIGPFTSVGPNVLIEGAEVENSIILAGTSVTHLSTRLEGSVIGPGARVFKDFRLPRAMRLNVGRGAKVAIS